MFPDPPTYTAKDGKLRYGIVFAIPKVDSLADVLGTPVGTFQWCQIVEKFSGTASNTTTNVSMHMPMGYAVDGTKDTVPWPYPAVDLSVAGAQAADAPSTPDIDAYSTVTAAAAFTMYLMYKPPKLGNNASFSVPLRKMSWGWTASFNFDLMNGWVEQYATSNPNSQADTLDATEYPTWTDWMGNYDPIDWH